VPNRVSQQEEHKKEKTRTEKQTRWLFIYPLKQCNGDYKVTDIDALELLNAVKKKEEDPKFPLAPFKRIIKIHTQEKYVASNAAEKLQELIYEFSEEIAKVADNARTHIRILRRNSKSSRQAMRVRKKEDH